MSTWPCQVHVHCPVCKQVQISYVIRSHIDQNTQESGLWLELQRKMDFHTKKRDRSYKKKATIGQKKGMAHMKRAWRSKKRAWRSAMLKGPRKNTSVDPQPERANTKDQDDPTQGCKICFQPLQKHQQLIIDAWCSPMGITRIQVDKNPAYPTV